MHKYFEGSAVFLLGPKLKLKNWLDTMMGTLTAAKSIVNSLTVKKLGRPSQTRIDRHGRQTLTKPTGSDISELGVQFSTRPQEDATVTETDIDTEEIPITQDTKRRKMDRTGIG